MLIKCPGEPAAQVAMFEYTERRTVGLDITKWWLGKVEKMGARSARNYETAIYMITAIAQVLSLNSLLFSFCLSFLLVSEL